MAERYRFYHLRVDGTQTGYVDFDRTNLRNRDEAIHMAIEKAKQMTVDGLSGTLVIEGTWDARGFELLIPLDNIGSIQDPYASLPEDIALPGYEKVQEVCALIWPWEAPNKIEEAYIDFKICNGLVDVRLSRPRGDMVEMMMGELKVEAYHGGPSLRNLMLTFGIKEEDARSLWQEVLNKLQALKTLYS